MHNRRRLVAHAVQCIGVGEYAEKKRKDYDDIIMNELDQLIRMNMARDEGLAEGRAEGRDEEKLDIAKKLLAMRLPLDQVAEATGLPKEGLSKLQ